MFSTLDKIFKAYDIRGVVPDELDDDIVWRVGWAFAEFTGAGRVIVGRDVRESSVSLANAFMDGVVAHGEDIVDIGLASTDMLYFASGLLSSPGVMFTASHNPPEYNGLKLCRASALPVGEATGLAEIKAMVTRDSFPVSISRGIRSREDIMSAYVAHALSFIDVGSLRPLRVVVDTANGMGGLVVPPAFEKLPFELIPLFFELDGSFPNHPADPLQPENLRDLQTAILKHRADIGIAFDGDADRVFCVDDNGNALSGSTTTALVAKGILERNPGEKVIHNLICSRAVAEVIAENGGTPLRSRVGHSFIKTQMAQTGAIFAGEHSGHFYFRDNYRADSGLIAALILLEQVCKATEPLSVMRKPFERYVSSGEINNKVVDKEATLERVAAAAATPDATVDWLDGLTVNYPDWWFNLRPSNTEPYLRLNVEADTPEILDAGLASVMEIIQG